MKLVGALLLAALVAAPALADAQALTDSLPILSINKPALADSAWRSDLACSGLKPRTGLGLAQVHWYVADLIAHSKNHNLLGYWGTPDSASIILDLRFASDFVTISHELLHYLRQVPGHPAALFVRACHLMTLDEADK